MNMMMDSSVIVLEVFLKKLFGVLRLGHYFGPGPARVLMQDPGQVPGSQQSSRLLMFLVNF